MKVNCGEGGVSHLNQGIDKTIDLLFDYQTFIENPELQSIIDRVNARFPSRMLSDDEADLVAAAGLPGMTLLRNKPQKKDNESS